ncbi:MAG: PKD domain-containing protein [Anaerolineae bacterium]|nr:PKD domain-containing protein [Anaerolineae bacterium]
MHTFIQHAKRIWLAFALCAVAALGLSAPAPYPDAALAGALAWPPLYLPLRLRMAPLARPATQTAGLQGYWPLDEVTGVRHDFSPNANHLSDVNGVGSAAGQWNGAAAFNGSAQYLSIAHGAQQGLAITGSLTLAGWFRPSMINYDTAVLAGRYEYSVNHRAFRLDLRSNGKIGWIVSPSGGYDAAQHLLQGDAGLQAGTWYHVAAVFDAAGQTLAIYLNGTLLTSRATVFNSIYAGTMPFMLGANLDAGTPAQFFNGLLDDWRIYNRALSAGEIAALMSPPAPTADFSAATLSGSVPLSVTFTNAATGVITGCLWVFGDGSTLHTTGGATSTLTNPAHLYTAPGVYTVSLTASGPGGSDVLTRSAYITATAAGPIPQGDAGSDRNAAEGDLLAFAATIDDPDTPTGHTLHWDFGDGSAPAVATALTITHAYGDDGVFTITLTVTDTTGLSANDSLIVTVANVAPLGCMTFCWVHYTYVPYLRVGDMTEVWLGHQFWELLSDYPFGQFAVTGLRLHLDVRDADGHVTRYTRELADRVGVDRREAEYKIRGMIPELLTAAVLEKFGPDAPALAHALDNHTLYFNPSLLAPEHAARAGESLLAAAPRILWAQPVSNGLADLETIANGGTLDVSGRLELAAVADTVEDTTQAFNRMFAASFVALSDQASAGLAATGLVKAYPDTPRITIASLVISATGVVTQAVPVFSLDLLHDRVRVLAYPGQARDAERVYRMTRGMTEKFLEKQVGEDLVDVDGGARVQSVAGILQAAVAQGIPLIRVDADHLDALARAELSEEAKARIVKAVQQGYTVLVPKRMAQVNGEAAVAWWQIDPATGETLGVGEDGSHQFIVKLIGFVLLLVIVISLVFLLSRCVRYSRAEALWGYFWFEQTAQDGWPLPQNGESLQAYYQRAFHDAKQHLNALP